MNSESQYSAEQLEHRLAQLQEEYAAIKAKGLALNMARGKPSSAQLDLSMDMLTILDSKDALYALDGTDCRNYGLLDGLQEAKKLMSVMLDDDPENVVVGGNSSLNLMYDSILRAWTFGVLGSTPWGALDEVKWICLTPGYDRHFGITETLGVKMIAVPLNSDGPDMDQVEALVADDASIKGIWCIPKYSNPSGITYSDEVVRRLASMECAAEDFRIFWDNAYCVHHLMPSVEDQDQLLDIGLACREAGHPDRYLKFASTSKVTFPGSGVAAMAASAPNIAEAKRFMGPQTIGPDKINQLRHCDFLKDAEGIARHMQKHAALIAPKFDLVDQKLTDGLAGEPDCSWNKPRGGYFISFNAPKGCATRIVALAKEAGVVMTGAGATFPYHKDPDDSNIRIAPTLPPLEELSEAIDVFCCCVKLAATEKALGLL